MKVLNTYIVSPKANNGLSIKTTLYELEDRTWLLNCPKFHEATDIITFRLQDVPMERATELIAQRFMHV